MSLFRPEYGEHFKVSPNRWWSPKDRKAAKMAAKIADYRSDEVVASAATLLSNHLIYGDSYVLGERLLTPDEIRADWEH